ncbi:MAG: hypothetical protein R3C53_19465 [Pirellulaceae bacterium]
MQSETTAVIPESAVELFSDLKSALDATCSTRSELPFSSMLDLHGFVRQDVSTKFTFATRHTKALAANYSIIVNYRSYDPSGPFQSEPDENRFRITIEFDGNVLQTYERSYIDQS